MKAVKLIFTLVLEDIVAAYGLGMFQNMINKTLKLREVLFAFWNCKTTSVLLKFLFFSWRIHFNHILYRLHSIYLEIIWDISIVVAVIHYDVLVIRIVFVNYEEWVFIENVIGLLDLFLPFLVKNEKLKSNDEKVRNLKGCTINNQY